MNLCKLDDEFYINVDYITAIYRNNSNRENWNVEIAGRESPIYVNENEKNQIIEKIKEKQKRTING